MDMTRSMNEQIVETLYEEALALADDVRAAFAAPPPDDAAASLALSIEGMRTTTRVLNVLAWLLNRRAYFHGEISARQLERVNRLGENRPSDRDCLAQLEPATRALIAETESLHRRVARLDADWRDQSYTSAPHGPVGKLQGRLSDVFGARSQAAPSALA